MVFLNFYNIKYNKSQAIKAKTSKNKLFILKLTLFESKLQDPSFFEVKEKEVEVSNSLYIVSKIFFQENLEE